MDLKTLHKSVLDTLFPIHCLGCSARDRWLCDDCLKRVPLIAEHVCPVCENRPTPSGRTCSGCRNKTSLSGLFVAAPYAHPLISRMIHTYKYRFAKDLAPSLGKILAASLERSDFPLPDLIIPVPLHPRRLRWRGFNQSELIAMELGSRLLPGFEIPLGKNAVSRKRFTAPQMGVKNHRHRQRNVRDAFSVDDKREIKNKRLWLVDDVATTGSTIFECARTLKKAGAREIYGVVIARQEHRR